MLLHILQCAVFVLCVLLCPGVLSQYYWAEWQYLSGTLTLEFWFRLAQALIVTAAVGGIGGWALLVQCALLAKQQWYVLFGMGRRAIWERSPLTAELQASLAQCKEVVVGLRAERAELVRTVDSCLQRVMACCMEEGRMIPRPVLVLECGCVVSDRRHTFLSCPCRKPAARWTSPWVQCAMLNLLLERVEEMKATVESLRRF